MRRFLPIIGLALACGGCTYGPGYGYGYGYGASYPAANYGYAAPAYGYGAPYYGYAPGAAVNFGYFGGGNYNRDHQWDGNNHWSGGQPHNWSGGDGRRWSGGDGHGSPQARAAAPAPAPRPAPPPWVQGGPGAGTNFGGPDGGASR
jgi:hypothetical protein